MGARGVTPKLQSRVLEVKAMLDTGSYTSDMAKHFNVHDQTMRRFLISMGWPHRKKCMKEAQYKRWGTI